VIFRPRCCSALAPGRACAWRSMFWKGENFAGVNYDSVRPRGPRAAEVAAADALDSDGSFFPPSKSSSPKSGAAAGGGGDFSTTLLPGARYFGRRKFAPLEIVLAKIRWCRRQRRRKFLDRRRRAKRVHLTLDVLKCQNFARQNYDRVIPRGAGTAQLAAVDALDRHRQFMPRAPPSSGAFFGPCRNSHTRSERFLRGGGHDLTNPHGC
jgi:hypothetical protein